MPLSYFKVSKLFKSSLEIIRVNKDKLNLHSFRSGTALQKEIGIQKSKIWKMQDDIKSKLSVSSNLGNYINKKGFVILSTKLVSNKYLILSFVLFIILRIRKAMPFFPFKGILVNMLILSVHFVQHLEHEA